ncbi:MAG: recombinase family protein [Planctomycetaceae bacterium]
MNSNRRKREPNVPSTVRCAIYTRKSSEEGLELEFNSLDAQREAGEAYITSQRSGGWVCLPQQYDDGGFSGGNMERPALKQLLDDIAAGKVDCVVIYKLDRLSRSLMDFARIMDVFDEHGVTFVSVTQQFNTSTSMGRLMLNVLLSFAQFEREIIGERIRDKIAAQRRRGKWSGGIPILGYDVDRSGNSPKLVINAKEAKRVREVFELYIQFGSLLPVVQELAARGWINKTWKTRKGEPRGGRAFDKSSLHSLLTNPLYNGKIKHKQDVFEGEHTAIIDDDTFARVQSQLDKNSRHGGTLARNKHGALLKGLLVCQPCQRMMTHTFTTKGNKRYRYYTCTRAIQNGHKTCPGRSLPADEIEKAIVDEVRTLADDPDFREDVLREAEELLLGNARSLKQEQRELELELARQHAEVKRLVTKAPTGSKTTAKIAELQEQISRTERRLHELKSELAEAGDREIDEGTFHDAFDNFEDLWKSLSPREQSEVLRLLIDKVEYDAVHEKMSLQFHPSSYDALTQGGAA